MSIITKASAKNYFLTGAFPTQAQFADTIDTYLGLGESGSQTVQGPVTFGSPISVSGDLTVNTGRIIVSAASVTGIVSAASLNVTGDVLAATGRVTASAATLTSKLSGATAVFTSIVSADGGLIAPTQTSTDNSTNVATTAFVQSNKHYKVGGFTRDVSTASGSQSVSGIGFKPKMILLRACFNSGGNAAACSWGEDDGTTAQCFTNLTGSFAPTIDSTNSIDVVNSGGNATTAKVSSFDSDGFTLAFIKTGSPTGILQVYFTAFG